MPDSSWCAAGAKVVAKASAEERVGVFVRKAGALQVVEYSELSPADASAIEPGAHQLLHPLRGRPCRARRRAPARCRM